MTPPPHPSSSPHNRQRWALYLFLIALRFFGAIYSLPGYIHPDEFFQGGQELFFGCQRHDYLLRGGGGQDDGGLWGQCQQGNSDECTMHENNDYVVNNVPWEFEPKHAVNMAYTRA